MSIKSLLFNKKFVNKYIMKKITLFTIVDYLFKFCLFFILNIIWCLYFFNSIIVVFVVSIIATVLEIVLIDTVSIKKLKRQKPKTEELQHMENINLSFIFMPHDQVVDFFYKLCSTKHNSIKNINYVEVLNETKTIVYPCFKNANLTSDDVIEFYNNCNKDNVKKIIILCNKFDSDINEVVNNLSVKIIVLDYKQTYYSLLKKYEFYPPITTQNKQTIKSSYKLILSNAFNKKRTRGYVVSSIFIIFASFFVSYRIYYLIVASILLVFAIICQTSKTSCKTETDII